MATVTEIKTQGRLWQAQEMARESIRTSYQDQIIGFLHACAEKESDFRGVSLHDLMLVGAGTKEAYNMLRDRGGLDMILNFFNVVSRTALEYLLSANHPGLKKEIKRIVDDELENLDKESSIQELVDERIILKINEKYFPRGRKYKWDPR